MFFYYFVFIIYRGLRTAPSLCSTRYPVYGNSRPAAGLHTRDYGCVQNSSVAERKQNIPTIQPTRRRVFTAPGGFPGFKRQSVPPRRTPCITFLIRRVPGPSVRRRNILFLVIFRVRSEALFLERQPPRRLFLTRYTNSLRFII